MDTSHPEKIGVNPLRVFFSPHMRNINPNVRYATHVYYFFWFFQSPTAETPAWILTLNTSNAAVLRKDDPFDSYTRIRSVERGICLIALLNVTNYTYRPNIGISEC